MDELSKEYVISFFDKNLMLHGDRPEAVRWSAPGQIAHYEAILKIADLAGTKVLDYGCGKGDLYQYLKDKNIEADYTGVDINENLISLARKKYPDAKFFTGDPDSPELESDYDYILLCGVFNLRIADLEETIRQTLLKLFARCKKGLAFNALSAHNPKKDFELNYVYPEDFFSFAVKNLSPFVTIRHDLIPYDFMMFVYRELNK